MIATDVYVTESSLGGGQYIYQIWVDGKIYEQLFLQPGAVPLTFSQQIDMGLYFKEGINYFE